MNKNEAYHFLTAKDSKVVSKTALLANREGAAEFYTGMQHPAIADSEPSDYDHSQCEMQA